MTTQLLPSIECWKLCFWHLVQLVAYLDVLWVCKRVDAWLPLNGVRPNKHRVCPEYCIAKVGAHELCKGKYTCSGCVQFPPLALDSQTFWNLSVTVQIAHLPQDHNRRLRKQLLGLPYCFPLFFSPLFPCFLFQVLYGAHLINLLSDSLCWSVISSTLHNPDIKCCSWQVEYLFQKKNLGLCFSCVCRNHYN